MVASSGERNLCQDKFKNCPWHTYSSRIDLATYLMKLASSQIDCADNSYIALFFLSLFCLVIWLSVISLSVLFFFVASWLQSEIIISIESNALLYYGVIANSDQSFHYYRILSRMVG